MPPPKELPGFYYDEEKNSYFPIKGPIPDSSRSSANLGPKKSIPRSTQVWKYQQTDGIDINITALEQLNIDVETFEGVVKTDVLVSGSLDGSLCYLEVRKKQSVDIAWMPDCVKNYAEGKTYKHDEVPAPVAINYGPLIEKPSRISCIRLGPRFSSHADDAGPNVRHVLYTHLGSETSGGSVHIIDLAEPFMLSYAINPIQEVASFTCTLWTAEYDYMRPRAVIGTNIGAASVDLETGQTSWFLHCKSDVFAEQLFNSGNSILCGLRNGAIIAIDFREKRDRFSSRHVTRRIPDPPLDKKDGSSNK